MPQATPARAVCGAGHDPEHVCGECFLLVIATAWGRHPEYRDRLRRLMQTGVLRAECPCERGRAFGLYAAALEMFGEPLTIHDDG